MFRIFLTCLIGEIGKKRLWKC